MEKLLHYFKDFKDLSFLLWKLEWRKWKSDPGASFILFPIYLGAFLFLGNHLIRTKVPIPVWEEFSAGFLAHGLIALLLFFQGLSILKRLKTIPGLERSVWGGSLPVKHAPLFATVLFTLPTLQLVTLLPIVFLFHWVNHGVFPTASQFCVGGFLWILLFPSLFFLSQVIPQKTKASGMAHSLAHFLLVLSPKELRPLLQKEILQVLRLKEPFFLFFPLTLSLSPLFFLLLYPDTRPPRWIVWALGLLIGHGIGALFQRIFVSDLKTIWIEKTLPISGHRHWHARLFGPLLFSLPFSLLFGLFLFRSGAHLSEPFTLTQIFHHTWFITAIAALCGAFAYEGNKKHPALNSALTLLSSLGFGFMLALHPLTFLALPVLIAQLHERMEWRLMTIELDEGKSLS